MCIVALATRVKSFKQKKLLEMTAVGFGVASVCFGVCGDPNLLIAKAVWLSLLLPSSWWAFHISFICQDSESKLLHCISCPRDLNSSCVCVCTFCESGNVMDPVGKQHHCSLARVRKRIRNVSLNCTMARADWFCGVLAV